MNFDQRMGFCLRSLHSTERPYFYRTPDELCFSFGVSVCSHSASVTNTSGSFTSSKRPVGCRSVCKSTTPRAKHMDLSTCVVWTRCSHKQFDSWSQLSGLWTVMLHPFGILKHFVSRSGFHAATRFMRGWVWAYFLTFPSGFPYLYSLLEELVRFSRDLGTTRHDVVPHTKSRIHHGIHSYVPCVAAIFEHCCLRSPLGYPSLANSASFCTALWCNVSASLAMRCTLSRAELRTARRCSNGVALSNRWGIAISYLVARMYYHF